MNVKFKYSNQIKEIDLPEESNLQIIQPNEVPKKNEKEVIQNSLKDKLSIFLQNVKKLLIIVNDGTRATPTVKVIEEIYPQIEKLEVTFVVALGSHRKPTEKEYHNIFGRFYKIYKNNIIYHDAKNGDMLELGTTSLGNKIKVNKLAVEHDKILIVSSVEPHYFAGYTGGRKSILPGISVYETIEKNHSFALLPEAKIMQLEGNPVHEDMLEAAAMLPTETWACLLVIDKDKNVFSAEFDRINEAFYKIIPAADSIYKVPIKHQADIVIAIVEMPLDIDLYQSQKAIENARNAIKEDGIFILVSACRQGIGNDNFYKLLSSCTTPNEVFSKIEKEYRLGYHKAAKFVDFMQKYQLWIVSEIDDEKLQKIFIKTKPDLQTAINDAIRIKGREADILIIREAGIIVPGVIKTP
ncbi:MAG: nickel-dependent lactate racemase [Candidatus Cloacimonetes bacterium]|nr:nickel-dependent lactate racemase [Candidatus Cloacimonadota bacterium]MCF7815340.1 nickel-dependent lactate racemase [Candidatus Cloacimonadota bacterium]MCF7867755.1 nickel-dependent lactate racemase [Candidatus Cloacimonadota bacterium]MCF7883159.1 nickel-dependent lactate racemase [Candidatus Cloacimonadota bacterium]